MSKFNEVEFGQHTETLYAVYNRTMKQLVREHGICFAGLPQYWHSDYKEAERILDAELKHYPNDHILTIIKQEVTSNITDTMPPR